MNWLNSIKVGSKLIGGFLIVAAIAALIGTHGVLKSSELNDLATQMYERETVGLRHTAEANMHLLAVGRHVRSAILATTLEERSSQLVVVEEHLKDMHQELEIARKTFATEVGQAMMKDAVAASRDYEQGIRKVIVQLQHEPQGQALASVSALSAVRGVGDRADALMDKLVERKYATASALNDETDKIYANIRSVMILLTLGGLAVGVTIGVVLTRNLTRQLGGEPADVAKVAVAVAAGDLSTQIDTSRARPGSVIEAMHEMQASLRRVVSTVRSSSDSIAMGAGQIATGNSDLSQRTEEQASNLQQTAASMEQISGTVRSNADVARQASGLASAASEVASRGGQVVGDVVATMEEINNASRKISDIIGVIDGIAFQTNILALNAAVEAARAGEQGRGFAVVASEVRGLAQRSAEAAKEIKVLIVNSVDKVDAGSRLVGEAGATMGDIVAQVQQVTQLINAISTATLEQTTGIGQVSEAVSQLDQVTQQNAALVEESAAAAESLSQQAQTLVRAVGVFKLQLG
ncbi:methyl-accepting chemotaxis protein [Paucibacter oligotrophus]|uniref:Methyl-accepting chemotaxis protein n=1 Tax=Roseateles oligotrophus TaxID=1769250 RepID=A0A840LBQ9_9BURK|nr:methyl-accepting chemotaxis protein [Roseateles oligotrophus]MBB4843628.1 methyl-accepting chemotaxis protein [Roseateles oligotrophus]